MLVAAAVCPHPPLLVPELAGAAAPELDGLRAACLAAVEALWSAGPEVLLVVGAGPRTESYGRHAAGSLKPWGVDVRVGEGDPVLPLSLTIGRWLLHQAADRRQDPAHRPGRAAEDHAGRVAEGGPSRAVEGHVGRAAEGGEDGPGALTGSLLARRTAPAADGFQAVAADAPRGECLALGARLAAGERRVGLLVMADGSARLTEKAPGYLDPAAQPYNELIVRALAGAEPAALARLDPAEAARLWVGGRPALQVLAGAAGDDGFEGRLLADEAPYGVGYFAAFWRRGTGTRIRS
ncbi:hypothetical protein [Thermoactinospora rubra]|uniref:hypothetical protein n=1 Tax=Thermoactinospora rubra TaxID=1088767 RepID=UPI00197EAAF1|nr:hypothetical protein [Thermoactinospora rubra]